jgi:nitric oxide reductase
LVLYSQLLSYLTELANKRNKEPKDDLISQLVTEQVQKGNLDMADAVQMAFLLLVAGNATMVNMISLVSGPLHRFWVKRRQPAAH